MDIERRLKLDMAERVRDFLHANPFEGEPGTRVAKEFEDLLVRGLELVALEQDGDATARAAVGYRLTVNRVVRTGPIRHLARIARAVAIANPDLAEKFRLPRGHQSELAFRARVGRVKELVAEHRDLFLAHGMSDEAPVELDRLVAEYDRAVRDGIAGRRTRISSRSELKKVTSRLIRLASQLDGMVEYRFRERPEVLAAWRTARNVAWPGSRGTTPPSGSGPSASAA